MTVFIGALLRAGAALRDLLITSAIVTGGTLMLGAGVYRFFLRPEWTAGEALNALWPFHVIGAMTLFIGWLIDRQPS